MPRLLNRKQVMDLVGVSARSTIYKWMDEGRLPQPTKRWGHPRWDSEEVNRAIRGENDRNTITIMVDDDCIVKRG